MELILPKHLIYKASKRQNISPTWNTIVSQLDDVEFFANERDVNTKFRRDIFKEVSERRKQAHHRRMHKEQIRISMENKFLQQRLHKILF